jgi:GT2 family glycosyltransferase
MNPISICIISHNRPNELHDLLKSVLLQRNLDKVINEICILNNGSTVSYAIVEKFILTHPELNINYEYSKENLGVSRGKSYIMRKASGEYLFVVDDDIEFNEPDDLIKLSNIFEEDFYKKNNVGIINVGIFYFETRKRQLNAFPHKNHKKYTMLNQFLTSYFIGAAALFRKDMVEKLDYYRDNILYGAEEYDLGYRAINLGYRIAYDGRIKVWHKESPLGRVSTNTKHQLTWYNKARIIWRYLPTKYYYSTNLLWGLRYLLKSKFDVKGFLKNIKMIHQMKKENPKEALSEKSLDYLKQVEARLWY